MLPHIASTRLPTGFEATQGLRSSRQHNNTVLRIRIWDPMPFWPLDPVSGMGRKSASRSGIRDEQPGSYFLELRNHFFGFYGVKILKFFDADPGSGMETVRIRDPGWKKVGSGIRDKHPGSGGGSPYRQQCTWRGSRCGEQDDRCGSDSCCSLQVASSVFLGEKQIRT